MGALWPGSHAFVKNGTEGCLWVWGTSKKLGQYLERPIILDFPPFPPWSGWFGLDSITGNMGEEYIELTPNICAHRCKCTRARVRAREKGRHPPCHIPTSDPCVLLRPLQGRWGVCQGRHSQCPLGQRKQCHWFWDGDFPSQKENSSHLLWAKDKEPTPYIKREREKKLKKHISIATPRTQLNK